MWTVDDPAQMQKLIDRGVDNIITNDPASLAQVLRERAQLTPAQRLLLRYQSLLD